MRIAVVDVGTNTALLLVAEATDDGHLFVLQSERRFVRLGEGLGKSGVICEAAISRLVSALVDFKARTGSVDAVRIVGTSASRDATNVDAVIERVRRATGWRYEVLSGDDEARYSHAGAMAPIPKTWYAGRATAVLDIGGGSTEITLCAAGSSELAFRTSMQFGTVRLSERFVDRQPVSLDAQQNIREAIRSMLHDANIAFLDNTLLVGAAGTAVTLSMLDRALTGSKARIDAEYFLGSDSLTGWRERLTEATFDEVTAMDPNLMHGRADVIPVGALIAEEVVTVTGVDGILVSPYSLRHGIAMEMLANQRRV